MFELLYSNNVAMSLTRECAVDVRSDTEELEPTFMTEIGCSEIRNHMVDTFTFTVSLQTHFVAAFFFFFFKLSPLTSRFQEAHWP